MDSQNKTTPTRKSARKMQGRFSKGDVRYWQSRVKKDDSKHFFVQIAHAGKRHRFTFKQTSAEAAAPLALAAYRQVVTNGWEAALAALKPEIAKRTEVATLGEFLAEVAATAGFRESTFRTYTQSLRQIAAEIADIGDQPKLDEQGNPLKDRRGRIVFQNRRDRLGGGNAAWTEKVHALSLSILSPEAVQRWRITYVARAGDAPDARRRAENTVAMLLRNSRALFSERAIKFVKGKVIFPQTFLPFSDVKLPKQANTRYQSQIDAETLIHAAKQQLTGAPFQIFVLAMLCGLRKREIDLLTWTQIDFTKNQLRIDRTQWFEPKSEDSIGSVDLDPELIALLRGWKATANGPFVIEPPIMPRKGAPARAYRIERHFKTLYTWLRNQSVKAHKPAHELRKELGAILASHQGIFAAQSVLRHAQISTTANFYADKKRVITAGLGALLGNAAGGNVTVGDFSAATPAA